MFVSSVCNVYVHNKLGNQVVTSEQPEEDGNVPYICECCGDKLVSYVDSFIPGARCQQLSESLESSD